MKVYDVVQFNETHKWCGCLGIINEIKGEKIMVGVSIPQQGIAYIYTCKEELEFIGKAVLIPGGEED